MSAFTSRIRRLSALACVVLFSATSALAQEPLPPAKEISGVWDVVGQPCNGNRGSSSTHHPQHATIEQTRRLELPELKMSLAVPQLPDYSATDLKVVMNDKSRGVKDHYVLFSEHWLGTPTAAIVITELPPYIDTKAKTFQAVVQMTRASAARAGLEPTFQRVPGPFGEALETIAPGRIGSHCFPTSDWKLAEHGAKDSTLGISRFVSMGNKLVEFSLILKVGPQLTAEEQAAYARKIMDRFWLALSVEGVGGGA